MRGTALQPPVQYIVTDAAALCSVAQPQQLAAGNSSGAAAERRGVPQQGSLRDGDRQRDEHAGCHVHVKRGSCSYGTLYDKNVELVLNVYNPQQS